MILDNQATYAAEQAVTALGDTPGTNSFDHGVGRTDMNGLILQIQVGTAFTSGGAATLQAVLQDSLDNTIWTDVQALTPAIPVASLTTRRTIAQARFPGGLRRYSRVLWRVAGAAMTGGTISARVTPAVDNQQYMPSGFRTA